MTIERRVEILGIPVKSKRLPIGTHDVLEDHKWAEGFWQDTSPVGKRYEDVVVTSQEKLVHRVGKRTLVDKKTMSADTTDTEYEGANLNTVDIEKSIIPGVRIVYRWTPTPKSEALGITS